MAKALKDPAIAHMIRNTVKHAKAGTTELVDEVWSMPSANYADPDFYQRELSSVFRRLPLMLAPSCELPNPGDYKTMTVAGVPVLLVRGQDGTMRAFVNSCTHRGAAVATAPSGNARRFTCDFHGWTFGQKGELLGIASAQEFGDFDKSCNGLKTLPVAERAGLIFVTLDPASDIDVDIYLAGFDKQLAHFNLKEWHYFGVLEYPSSNWKLTYDGTLDYYHLTSLHRNTLNATGVYLNRVIQYPYGPHQRIMDPDGRLRPLADMPEEQWTDEQVLAGNWSIFPNVSIAGINAAYTSEYGNRRAILLVQILPGATVDSSTSRLMYLLEEAPQDEHAALQARSQFEFLGRVQNEEDIPVGNSQQKSFGTGVIDTVFFGRNEGPIQSFHKWIDKVMMTEDANLNGLFANGQRLANFQTGMDTIFIVGE